MLQKFGTTIDIRANQSFSYQILKFTLQDSTKAWHFDSPQPLIVDRVTHLTQIDTLIRFRAVVLGPNVERSLRGSVEASLCICLDCKNNRSKPNPQPQKQAFNIIV